MSTAGLHAVAAFKIPKSRPGILQSSQNYNFAACTKGVLSYFSFK